MNTNDLKTGVRDERGVVEVPAWWADVPGGEKILIHALVRMLRSAKRSKSREVARAAAQWERGLGCFIKTRLMNRRRARRVASREKGEG
jgi:hypothetical protein